MKVMDQQTALDLEFDSIRTMLAERCHQPTARTRAQVIEPLSDARKVREALELLHEFYSIRSAHSAFPAIDFEEIASDIRTLELKNSVLDEIGFERLFRSSVLVNSILETFQPLAPSYPAVSTLLEGLYGTPVIIEAINGVFDARWKVRDEASVELAAIRAKIAETRKTIQRNFQKVLRDAASRNLLADTSESYVNNRKVLAVLSTHKRKISGIVCGSSQTGSITYIEPEINVPLNFELEMLLDDERTEVRKILASLTHTLRVHLPLISLYQRALTELDFIQACYRLAADLNAVRPELTEDPVIELNSAFHPLLWLNNKRSGRKTIPQHISLDKFSRMLVISGPNAGGKSITMKTIGLLQLMLQSGLFVPVAEGSRMSVFQAVMTDIGDNQSIENQLSTYSYRLKRMKHFLDHANRRTLVLLDEFGTGSDPDLGGALAEVFFEELYNRKCFGVITTHYGNIKLKAQQLRNARNGCMLFDSESLEPTYQLSIGQPGSSFTFEVATMNGIPEELISKAKGLMSEQKVAMDKMLSTLQEQKTALEKEMEAAMKAARFASETIEDFEKKKERYEERLKKQEEVIERNNKHIARGKKMTQFVEAFKTRGKNKELIQEVQNYLMVEKSRIEDERKEKSIRTKIRKQSEEERGEVQNRENIKPGCTVRLSQTRQTGTVLEVDGNDVVVAFGNFKTHVEIGKLIWIR